MSTLVAIATATLTPLTPEAREALGGAPDLHLTRFPFRIGRENRMPTVRGGLWSAIERRFGTSRSLNDLYLVEPFTSGIVHISREHCAISANGDEFVLTDRESSCGTIVAGRPVGGNRRGGCCALHDGDIITLGGKHSPYAFRFASRGKQFGSLVQPLQEGIAELQQTG